jgi:TPR repeat protein
MKSTLAFILLLAWLAMPGTSPAWAQAASNGALTSLNKEQRNDSLRSQILSAEQAVKKEDWATALPAWQKLARSGADAAPAQLCRLYFDARQEKFDAAIVTDWCRQAAGVGDADGLYRLGLLYLVGLGVPKNIDQAEGFCAAAQDRDAKVPAKFCLAAIAAEQVRAARTTLANIGDRSTSPASSTAASADGSPRDMCERAFVAIGTTFDVTAVMNWCGEAARGDDPGALERTGLMHLAGLGGSRDLDLAQRDCANAKAQSQGHLSAAFCLAAVAEERRALNAAAQGGGLAGRDLASDQATGRPIPATLPDPFAADRALDEPRRTAAGLDYTCRKMAEWARFEAPGLVILAPRDKLFGKAILAYGRQDFDELDSAARACADAIGRVGGDRLRHDLDQFRVALTDLRTRQTGLQGERQQARAEAAQLAGDRQFFTREQKTLKGDIAVNASLATPQDQACVEHIIRGMIGSLQGEDATLDVRNTSRTDANGSYVVHGEARITQKAGDWQQAHDFGLFTCNFIGHTEKVTTSVLAPPP